MKLEAGRDEEEGHLEKKKDVEMELQKIFSILLVAFDIKVIHMLLSKASNMQTLCRSGEGFERTSRSYVGRSFFF